MPPSEAVDSRGRADEELRQYLTVVTGYLSLLLEERDAEPGPDHWVWLERAHVAARRATGVLELLDQLDEAAGPPPEA